MLFAQTAVAQVRAKQMQQATLIFRNLARCPDVSALYYDTIFILIYYLVHFKYK